MRVAVLGAGTHMVTGLLIKALTEKGHDVVEISGIVQGHGPVKLDSIDMGVPVYIKDRNKKSKGEKKRQRSEWKRSQGGY